MKKTRILKILIIIFIIIIIGIIVSLLILNSNKTSNNIQSENIITAIDKEGYVISDPDDLNAIREVDDKYSLEVKNIEINSNYFTVQSIAEKYIILMMTRNKDELKSIIAPSYIKKYNINNNNILNMSDIPKSDNLNYQTFLSDIKECINGEKSIYFVSGKGITLNDNKFFNYKIMIELDTVNKLYIIYPEKYLIDNGLNNIKVGDVINEKYFEKIEDSQNNRFTYKKDLTDLEIVQKYVYDFKSLLTYDRDSAYSHLDSNYSKLRFENKDNFNNYYEDNKIILALLNVNRYKVEKKDNYIDYIFADNYKNIYTIRKLDGISNYKVFLDNYTIPNNKDSDEYNKANKKDKARRNLNKFLNMINTKDFDKIYKILNPTFRENNFKNIENLRTYIQNNFYEINSLNINKDAEKDDYYAFSCELVNLRNTKEIKNVNIIITKTNNTDFRVSFSF